MYNGNVMLKGLMILDLRQNKDFSGLKHFATQVWVGSVLKSWELLQLVNMDSQEQLLIVDSLTFLNLNLVSGVRVGWALLAMTGHCGRPQAEYAGHGIMAGCLRKLPRGVRGGLAETCPPGDPLRVLQTLQSDHCRWPQQPAGGRPAPLGWGQLSSVCSVLSSCSWLSFHWVQRELGNWLLTFPQSHFPPWLISEFHFTITDNGFYCSRENILKNKNVWNSNKGWFVHLSVTFVFSLKYLAT